MKAAFFVYKLIKDKTEILEGINEWLKENKLPPFWEGGTEFSTEYRINGKSIGFDYDYWCACFWIDHPASRTPLGSSLQGFSVGRYGLRFRQHQQRLQAPAAFL